MSNRLAPPPDANANLHGGAMKVRLLALLLVLSAAAGWLVWWSTNREPWQIVEGRSLLEWVREAEIEGPGEKHPANELLYAQGPRLLPALSRLLMQRESSVMARLPRRWVPDRIQARQQERLALRAKAAWIIGVIAFRDAGPLEMQAAVPGLSAALDSQSVQVQYLAAQALGAVGPAASSATPKLVRSTTHDSESVRLCAVEALGRIGASSPASWQAITAALCDSNAGVRFVATQALARVPNQIETRRRRW